MDDQPYQPKRTWVHKFLLFAGVIMPAISITVEATTHICAEEFFDPIPTVWHLMLVIFVPLANLHVWFAIRRGDTERLTLSGLANAAAIAISAFYSVVYIPLMPLAAIALIVGLGLLPLAPLLTLLASLLMRRQLKAVAARAPQKSFAMKTAGLLAGLTFTFAVIGLIELPASLTRYGLQLATSSSPDTRTRGISFLRKFGSEDYLLRACYSRSGWATDLIGYLFSVDNPVSTSEAQKIYYRVTGKTFDSSIPPDRVGGRVIPRDEFDFDADQGGVEVGSKLKGLSLASSNLDASVDANGGVGYMQWTLVFRNVSMQQREARAEVQLPPGGVVSRLTLWVNGEEREAAFAGRNQVRAAYQQVVVRERRDPVLVTTAGPDRILVQCFPVPPNGEMKIRFGITVPLLLEDVLHARLLLPHFVTRNFRIPNEVTHSVWIESNTPMESEYYDLRGELLHTNEFAIRGPVPETELAKPSTSIRFNRSAAVNEMWSKDPFETNGFIVRQSIQERVATHLRRIVLVVDTSATMGGHAWEIGSAIRSLPSDFDIKLVLTDSEGRYENNSSFVGSDLEQTLSRLQSVDFQGGVDNLPALLKGWDLAAQKPGNNAIVWIHGPQLLQFQPVEGLRQRWERRPYGPQLYSVQVSAGADEIQKKLDGINEVKQVPRTDRLGEDLKQLFARLTGQRKTLEFVRTSQKVEKVPDASEAVETSAHLARLWANDEVTRILSAREEKLNAAAMMLAVRYQLVTPISGAVVLETAAQYDAAGLKPVDPGTVPTIPEPEMLVLLAVAGVFLIWLVFRKKYRAIGCGI
jgi:hypothetical protein